MISCVFLVSLFSLGISQSNESVSGEEIYRVALNNFKDGKISVSRNMGATWDPIGRVLFPCQKVNIEGYTASKWAKEGAIAASAVNAIHINAGTNETNGRGIVFSIVPRDMMVVSPYYNSFSSPDSSIYVDMKAGEGIFGGGYAPFVGNPVFVYDGTSEVRIKQGYVPKIGQTFVIKVYRPYRYPRSMVFENREGGSIAVNYAFGSSEIIGKVMRPVWGVGRFSGTQYSDAGRIRANHTGVIDISTSILGETGGFQIIPSMHAQSPEMGRARTMTQWMIIAPTASYGPTFEGHAPFFSGFLQPKYRPMDLESDSWYQDLLGRYIVDVKLEGSDDWQPMPRFAIDPDLRKPLPDWVNSALRNVTYIRILFPVGE